jgi:hypothetical protein
MESVSPLLELAHARITRRAYQIYVERGCVAGHELGDWLEAESELFIRPEAEVHLTEMDVIVEIVLPKIDLPSLTVHVAPFEIAVSSATDDGERWLLWSIELPCEISLDGLDAERSGGSLQIAAARADRSGIDRASA